MLVYPVVELLPRADERSLDGRGIRWRICGGGGVGVCIWVGWRGFADRRDRSHDGQLGALVMGCVSRVFRAGARGRYRGRTSRLRAHIEVAVVGCRT